MFTGIVECLAQVKAIKEEKGNVTFSFESPISNELKIDQSVSHNGVCLTVIDLSDGLHSVTAIEETLKKTNLGQLRLGEYVNIERCMPALGRFDGHIVQGHVDTTGKCIEIKETNGSWLFTFWHPNQPGFITVEKGSICVNGTSLTVVDSKDDQFSVAIIPYTYENTVFKYLKTGDLINLEFDVIGKYVQKMLGLKNRE
jgi:riboflavin synthase